MAGPSSHHRGLSAAWFATLVERHVAAHVVPAAVDRYLDQHAVLGNGVEQEVLDERAGEAETATRHVVLKQQQPAAVVAELARPERRTHVGLPTWQCAAQAFP